jgi:phosphatidylglycerophosphate synthase
MPRRREWLTRANTLTLLRLLLAPVLANAVIRGDAVLATAVFWLAVATDVADGRVARRYGEVSPYGRLADHAADATFVCVGTAALAWTGALPFALSPLIAIAFLLYALSDPAPEGSRRLARRLGHWNGIAYYVAVAVPVIRDALGLAWPGASLLRFLGWALVVTTLLSIAGRLAPARSTE